MTKWWLLAAAGVAIAVAMIAARPIATPGPLSRDFEAYWAAGNTYGAHADPYGREIWDAERGIAGVDARRTELLPFVGPPHTLLFWRLAARLSYERAASVWWFVLGVSLLALVAAIIHASGMRLDAAGSIAGTLLALSFAPITSDLALGQIALPAFLGATLVVVLARRYWLAAALAACVAFAQPNAAIGLASQIGRTRATLAIALGALLTYLLGALATGWEWPLRYLTALGEHGRAERFSAIQFDPASLAFDFGATAHEARIVELVIAIFAVAAALALAIRVRDAFARFAGFSALAPFVTGFFHEHDFTAAFAAALWCALRTRGAIRIVALAGSLLTGFDWLGLAQRPSGIAQSALLGGAAFAAFVALGVRSDARAAVPVALLFAGLIAVAATIALHSPVPVWPDAQAAIHLPANAGVAAIWHEEQRATGLLAPVPAWGLLRVCSLLGSALLAYAIYRHPSYCRTA